MKKIVKAILIISLAVNLTASVYAKTGSQSGTITPMHEKNGG